MSGCVVVLIRWLRGVSGLEVTMTIPSGTSVSLATNIIPS